MTLTYLASSYPIILTPNDDGKSVDISMARISTACPSKP